MTAMRPNRLTDLTNPPRPKPRYAPLTAGLLARKGEAAPATSFFTTDASGLHAGGARIALPPLDQEIPGDWEEAHPHWRRRRPLEEDGEHLHVPTSHAEPPAHEMAAAHVHVGSPTHAGRESPHASLPIDLKLETLARLVLAAKSAMTTPAHIVESALAAYLPGSEAPCPLCDSPQHRS